MNHLMIDPPAFPSASQLLPAAAPHHPPQARLTPRLMTPVALAFAALLLAAPSTRAAQTDLPGPTGSGTFGVTDSTYSLTTPTAVANVGAVHLYNGSTLALISTLTGSTANDQMGGDGVTVLSNGNYVVSSGDWDNGAVLNVGAVTCAVERTRPQGPSPPRTASWGPWPMAAAGWSSPRPPPPTSCWSDNPRPIK
jgi:hypothetical protein